MSSTPGLGRSPGEGYGNSFSILAWEIPWTEEPGGFQSIGSQKSWTWLKTLSSHAHRFLKISCKLLPIAMTTVKTAKQLFAQFMNLGIYESLKVFSLQPLSCVDSELPWSLLSCSSWGPQRGGHYWVSSVYIPHAHSHTPTSKLSLRLKPSLCEVSEQAKLIVSCQLLLCKHLSVSPHIPGVKSTVLKLLLIIRTKCKCYPKVSDIS